MPIGMRQALRNLQSEIEISLADRKGRRKARAYRQSTGLLLHLGCGKNYKEGWVNVDIGRHKIDVNLDLRRTPLPFPSSSCKMIYSEHVLEHFTYPEPATSILKECYRLLEPGGILNIVVPDGEMVVNAYVLGGSDEYYEAEERFHPAWCHTKMEHLNYGFRQGTEHHFYYDYETLARALDLAGFKNIQRRSFDPNIDTASRQIGSLYVVGEKPL